MNTKKLKGIVAIACLVAMLCLPFIQLAKADTGTIYAFAGPFQEDTSALLSGNCKVTAVGSNGEYMVTTLAASTGAINWTYTNPPLYFRYDYNETADTVYTRYCWLNTTQQASGDFFFYACFSNESLSTIAFNIFNYRTILDFSQGAFLVVKSPTVTADVIIEKRPIDSTGSVSCTLKPNTPYAVSVESKKTGTNYDLGTVNTVTSAITLTIPGTAFPENNLLVNKYVHAYATREYLNPVGAITVSYEDITEQTDSVNITITDSDGAVVFIDVYPDNQSFVCLWQYAVNATDYEVTVTATTSAYGTLTFKQFLLGEYSKASSPFSLAFLGSLGDGINVAWFIPAFLIICVSGCFSEVNAEVAAVITTIVAVILTALGWIDITPAAIVVALSLSIMACMVAARRRFT